MIEAEYAEGGWPHKIPGQAVLAHYIMAISRRSDPIPSLKILRASCNRGPSHMTSDGFVNMDTFTELEELAELITVAVFNNWGLLTAVRMSAFMPHLLDILPSKSS